MAQAEVVVENSKSDLVTRYKERIELLFNVVVSVKNVPNRPGSVDYGCSQHSNTTFALHLSSPTSQESLEKALIFLKAVLEESPDFTIERQSFPHEDFEMVLKDSQAIERQCLTVLDFDLSTLELCMKGQRVHVEAARQQVQRRIMGQQTIGQSNLSQGQSHVFAASGTVDQQHQGVQNVASELPLHDKGSGGLQDQSCDLFDSSVRDLDNNVIVATRLTDSMKSYSLTTDAEQPLGSLADTALIARGSPVAKSLSRTFAEVVSLTDFNNSKTDKETDDVRVMETEHKVKEVLSGHSSTASSDEDSGVNVVDKSDPRYEVHLEFAVKLGYTECDLDKVINKHGLACDENRLLQELIENSAGCINLESEGTESLSPVLRVPDIASSEVFQGVMKKLNKSEDSGTNLRHIVIDGSNVAMSHGKNVFSCRGIKIAVDWFKHRGHEEITVFVPQWRKETSRPDTPITDQNILIELEREGIVVFTPARRIKGRRVVCYDDRFVLKLAAETGGIVVSNDNYRDLLNENQEYRTVVDERLLMYTFVNDRFMPPEDPMGRRGPTLDNFLCKEPTNPPTLPPECPYGRKCTYGNKCKYHHPERGSQPHKTVTEVLKEQATIKMQERAVKGPEPVDKARRSKPKLTRTRSLAPGEPLPSEKNSSSTLPAALKEPDTDTFSRLKSPTRAAGKTSDYLRGHRKKLEEALAIASAADAGAQGSAVCNTPDAVAASRPQEVLSPLPGLGSRVSSPSHLNVPFSRSQEGQLVSGHLLLAKKLSDEASESSFFSESSSNRASPVALAGPAMPGISHQDSMPYGLDKFYDRRPSLQEHHQHHQQSQQYNPSPLLPRDADIAMGMCMSGPARLPSGQFSGFQHDPAFMAAPVHGSQCQSYPSMEKEAPHNILRRVMSYSDQPAAAMYPAGAVRMEVSTRECMPVKPQHSSPPSQFLPTPTHFSGRPFGSMKRQNSSSDPQLHVTGSSDAPFSPWHPSPNPPPPLSGLDSRGARPMPALDSRGPHPAYSPAGHRAYSETRQSLHRSTSTQPFGLQQPFGVPVGLDRQFSEVMYGSHDPGLPPSSPYMSQMGVFHSHPSTPIHHPSTPTHPPPPSSHLPPWPQNPALRMPPSPVKSAQPAQRSFPADHPIPTSDSRYPLYYNLCGIFAEPRVRAVMNKFPDETDPQKLCNSIMREL